MNTGNKNISQYRNTLNNGIKRELICKLTSLEYKANLLKRLRKIENILLNSGAYSTHNLELQNMNFEKLKVPEWERKIINDGKNAKTKLSHKLLKEYEELIKQLNEEMKT